MSAYAGSKSLPYCEYRKIEFCLGLSLEAFSRNAGHVSRLPSFHQLRLCSLGRLSSSMIQSKAVVAQDQWQEKKTDVET